MSYSFSGHNYLPSFSFFSGFSAGFFCSDDESFSFFDSSSFFTFSLFFFSSTGFFLSVLGSFFLSSTGFLVCFCVFSSLCSFFLGDEVCFGFFTFSVLDSSPSIFFDNLDLKSVLGRAG